MCAARGFIPSCTTESRHLRLLSWSRFQDGLWSATQSSPVHQDKIQHWLRTSSWNQKPSFNSSHKKLIDRHYEQTESLAHWLKTNTPAIPAASHVPILPFESGKNCSTAQKDVDEHWALHSNAQSIWDKFPLLRTFRRFFVREGTTHCVSAANCS